MTTSPDLTPLIQAYTRWDQACTRISDRAQTAIDTGQRPPRLPANTLADETTRLLEAEQALGLPLGWDRRLPYLRRTHSLGAAIILAVHRALHMPDDHDHHKHDQQDHQ